MSGYQDPKDFQKYLQYLNSHNGQLQQKFLFEAISSALSPAARTVLDAGCGSGWLAGRLAGLFPNIYGCDLSSGLLKIAKLNYPKLQFSAADLTKELPYSDGFFDAAVLNMAAPDISNLPAAFINLEKKLAAAGQLIITVPNPSYTYPAAVWKRGLWGWLLGKKPRLKKNPGSGKTGPIRREFLKGQKIDSSYYSLDDYIGAARQAGFLAKQVSEIKSSFDSNSFDLAYQLYRYPVFLLIEFKKQG